MEFGIEYYYCYGICLFCIMLLSIGFYCTDKQRNELQFLFLIIIPIIIFAFFIFRSMGWTIFQSLLGTFGLFTILSYLGDILEPNWISNIQFQLQGNFLCQFIDFILVLISRFGVAILSFIFLYLITSLLITLIFFGILFLIFFIILFTTYEDFSNWSHSFLVWFDLITIIIIIGYFGWSQFPLLINISVYSVFIFIIIHFIVDFIKPHGIKNAYGPHMGLNRVVVGEYSYDSYEGASAIPLGFAVVIATGFTSWYYYKSIIFTLVWIGFGILCYYVSNELLYYYNVYSKKRFSERRAKTATEKYYKDQGNEILYGLAMNNWKKDHQSKWRKFLYETNDIRKYFLFLFLVIVIVAILPVVWKLFFH